MRGTWRLNTVLGRTELDGRPVDLTLAAIRSQLMMGRLGASTEVTEVAPSRGNLALLRSFDRSGRGLYVDWCSVAFADWLRECLPGQPYELIMGFVEQSPSAVLGICEPGYRPPPGACHIIEDGFDLRDLA